MWCGGIVGVASIVLWVGETELRLDYGTILDNEGAVIIHTL